MKRTYAYPVVIGLLAAACSFADEPNTVGSQSFRIIPNVYLGGGYFSSIVILSAEKLDSFLNDVSEQSPINKNKRTDVKDALGKAKLDFTKEALVILRHTEGYASTKVNFETPVLKSKKLICKITTDIMDKKDRIGLPITADYCWVLAVAKSEVEVVELYVNGAVSAVLPLEKRPELVLFPKPLGKYLELSIFYSNNKLSDPNIQLLPAKGIIKTPGENGSKTRLTGEPVRFVPADKREVKVILLPGAKTLFLKVKKGKDASDEADYLAYFVDSEGNPCGKSEFSTKELQSEQVMVSLILPEDETPKSARELRLIINEKGTDKGVAIAIKRYPGKPR